MSTVVSRRLGARRYPAAALAAWLLPGCIPEGPPTGSDPPPAPRKTRPAPTIPLGTDPPLSGTFSDDFERAALGASWRPLSSVWRIKDGQLCGQGARNRGVWLRRTLPIDARIEFDARSMSADGDLKAELWGDGRTGATKVSYTDATSYLTIFGGWKNQWHVLARIDEHGSDRKSVRTEKNGQDPRTRPVVPGQVYHFKVERRDGKTLSWWVDGTQMFELRDPDPLAGPGHDHFGFNNWTAPVCFDNVKITPL